MMLFFVELADIYILLGATLPNRLTELRLLLRWEDIASLEHIQSN